MIALLLLLRELAAGPLAVGTDQIAVSRGRSLTLFDRETGQRVAWLPIDTSESPGMVMDGNRVLAVTPNALLSWQPPAVPVILPLSDLGEGGVQVRLVERDGEKFLLAWTSEKAIWIEPDSGVVLPIALPGLVPPLKSLDPRGTFEDARTPPSPEIRLPSEILNDPRKQPKTLATGPAGSIVCLETRCFLLDAKGSLLREHSGRWEEGAVGDDLFVLANYSEMSWMSGREGEPRKVRIDDDWARLAEPEATLIPASGPPLLQAVAVVGRGYTELLDPRDGRVLLQVPVQITSHRNPVSKDAAIALGTAELRADGLRLATRRKDLLSKQILVDSNRTGTAHVVMEGDRRLWTLDEKGLCRIKGDTLLFSSAEGLLAVHDLRSGRRRWQTRLPVGGTLSRDDPENALLVVGPGKAWRALDFATGRVLAEGDGSVEVMRERSLLHVRKGSRGWIVDLLTGESFEAPHESPLGRVPGRGHLVEITGSRLNGPGVGLLGPTGMLWQRHVPMKQGAGTALVLGDRLLVLTATSVVAFQASDGELAWIHPADPWATGLAVVGNGEAEW